MIALNIAAKSAVVLFIEKQNNGASHPLVASPVFN